MGLINESHKFRLRNNKFTKGVYMTSKVLCENVDKIDKLNTDMNNLEKEGFGSVDLSVTAGVGNIKSTVCVLMKKILGKH